MQNTKDKRFLGEAVQLDRDCELGRAGERAIVSRLDDEGMTLTFASRSVQTGRDYRYLVGCLQHRVATKRLLVGRRIVDVKLNRFSRGGRREPLWTYDPVIVLDNGACLTFVVDELESGSDYGITPYYSRSVQP